MNYSKHSFFWHLTYGHCTCWMLYTDLIFVTNITKIIGGEKIVLWRNFSFPCMTIVGKWKISPHVEKLWEILGYLGKFCHNLRVFMWRKIEPKSTFVEKK